MVSSFPMKKNTATKIVFPILDADGDPVTGAAGLDSEYSLDGGAFVDCTNEATEIATASGIYYLNLTLGETNGDVVAIQVKTTSSGAKTTVLVFYTAAQTLDETDVVADAIKAKTDLIGASVALETGGNIATILADTNELQTDWVNGGRLDVLLDSSISKIDAVDDYVDTEVAAIKAKTDLIGASVALESGGNIATILADTNELQTDWVNGGRLDLLIDAIKAKTDNLPSDPADESLIEAAITAAHATTNGKIDAVDDFVDTEVAAIKAVTDTLSLTTIADAILDEVVEGTTTLRQAIRLVNSMMSAKSSGGGTATLVYRDIGDSKDRITFTADADGNRTAVTRDAT